jgi:hypothetical protein
VTRLRFLLAPFLLPACGSDEAPPSAPPRKQAPKPAPAPRPAPAARDAPDAASGDAAALVRRYYELIGEGRLEQAWRLRAGGGDLERFTASYARYARTRATVGTPSLPVESGGFVYLDVPVQIVGTMADGAPFATAGTVTLRRQAGGGAWGIYGG